MQPHQAERPQHQHKLTAQVQPAPALPQEEAFPQLPFLQAPQLLHLGRLYRLLQPGAPPHYHALLGPPNCLMEPVC